jgi:hypothetical protein
MAIINAHDPITRVDSAYIKSMAKLYQELGTSRGQSQGSSGAWIIGEQELHPFGDLIILKDTSKGDDKNINGYTVDPQSFGNLIFCDRKMHQKSEYIENIKLLGLEREKGLGTDAH